MSRNHDSHKVLLGVAGDLFLDTDKLTHRSNKAGGRPAFAGSTPPLHPSDLACGICGRRLCLIVQVCKPPNNSLAPLLLDAPSFAFLMPIGPFASQVLAPGVNPGAQLRTTGRVLYIFGCTHEGCGQQDGSWRAFSQQLPSQKENSSTIQAADRVASEAHATGSQQLDWNVPEPGDISIEQGTGWPSSEPDTSDDWGFSGPDQAEQPSKATADAEATSTSLADLSAALEGLSTSASTAPQVPLSPHRISASDGCLSCVRSYSNF